MSDRRPLCAHLPFDRAQPLTGPRAVGSAGSSHHGAAGLTLALSTAHMRLLCSALPPLRSALLALDLQKNVRRRRNHENSGGYQERLKAAETRAAVAAVAGNAVAQQ